MSRRNLKKNLVTRDGHIGGVCETTWHLSPDPNYLWLDRAHTQKQSGLFDSSVLLTENRGFFLENGFQLLGSFKKLLHSFSLSSLFTLWAEKQLLLLIFFFFPPLLTDYKITTVGSSLVVTAESHDWGLLSNIWTQMLCLSTEYLSMSHWRDNTGSGNKKKKKRCLKDCLNVSLHRRAFYLIRI